MTRGQAICLAGCLPAPQLAAYLTSVVVVLVGVLVLLLWDASRTPVASQAAMRANRHATLASVLGVALLLLILSWIFGGFFLGVMPSDGRILSLLPALAAMSLLLVQAVGQLTWPRQTGARRDAELVRRSVADVAPMPLRRLVHIWGGFSLAALLAFGLVADGPRTLVRDGNELGLAGPYPGWYYGIPMGIATVGVVIATEAVLRLVALRPAVPGVSREWDMHLRRRSAAHIVQGTQFVLALGTAGILVAAGWVHLAVGRAAQEGPASPLSNQHIGAGLLVAAVGVALCASALSLLQLVHRMRTRSSLEKQVVAR